jgi:hypothetical protein
LLPVSPLPGVLVPPGADGVPGAGTLPVPPGAAGLPVLPGEAGLPVVPGLVLSVGLAPPVPPVPPVPGLGIPPPVSVGFGVEVEPVSEPPGIEPGVPELPGVPLPDPACAIRAPCCSAEFGPVAAGVSANVNPKTTVLSIVSSFSLLRLRPRTANESATAPTLAVPDRVSPSAR